MNLVLQRLVIVLGFCLSHINLHRVSAKLPAPENVTLQTLNTNYVLRWVWLQSTEDQVATFTVRCLPKYMETSLKKNWKVVCTNISETRCDLTGLDLHYWGIFVLEVQAHLDSENSEWVRKEFCPDKDAELGTPSRVEVSVVEELLKVTISDPLTSTNSSMKEKIPSLSYRILYWETTGQGAVYRHLDTVQNEVTLSKLEPLTVYCVKVQSRYNYYSKVSSFSAPQCQQTGGRVPPWQVFLFFLLAMVGSFLCILLPSYAIIKSYQLIKATFFPTCQIPSSLEQYLYESSPSSDRPSLLTSSDEQVHLEKLDASLMVVPLDVHAAPELEETEADAEDAAAKHSRQASGDSGVYSTEERMARRDELKLVVMDSGIGRLGSCRQGAVEAIM